MGGCHFRRNSQAGVPAKPGQNKFVNESFKTVGPIFVNTKRGGEADPGVIRMEQAL